MNIEPLETRIAPATFIVTTLVDNVAAMDTDLSLREAIVAANDTRGADTIKFAPTLAGTLTLTMGQLNITDTLTILGAGKITLSANNAGRIFGVNDADTVKDHPLTVSGLTFTKGNVVGSGGAIESTEGLTILNCLFVDNKAVADGGAVSVSTLTGAVVVKNSHFLDNKSTNGFGGGLLATANKGVTVAGSVFAGNTANIFGGANLSVETGTAKVVVTGSVFANNTANGGGGGLGASGKTVAITDTRFTGNTAGGDGGGLSLGGGGYTLSGLQFIGNTGSVGGAISSASGAKTITLTKSLLEGNAATLAGGGGIFLAGSTGGLVATISATQIVGNTAQTSGGGIFAQDTGGRITISGSLISANTAGSQSGGVAIHQNDDANPVVATLTGNTISGNNGNGSGGLSLFGYGDFILTKNVIAGNRANGTGGVEFDLRGDLTMKSNQVVGNQSVNRTGGMRLAADTASTFTNSGNLIAQNEGGETGGLSILSSADVTIAKTMNITGNIGGSANHAGGLTVESGGGTVIVNTLVLGNHNRVNTAVDQLLGNLTGAPLTLQKVAGNITVTNLNDSGAGSLRAAIAQANETPGLDRIRFDDTLASRIVFNSPITISEPLSIDGRGLITLSGDGATNLFVIDNPDAKDRPVTLKGLTFSQAAGTRGSAIAAFDSLTILDCIFADNDAGAFNGGAIFAELGKATLTIKGSHFADNSGGLGAGVFASSDKALTIANSVFAGNSATSSGGGANLVGTATATQISVTGSLFAGNASLVNGAGLAIRNFVDGAKASKASVVNSSFFGNGAQASGGGLALESGSFALTGVQVARNTAGVVGGGVSVSNSASKSLTISKSLIAENLAASSDGGGGVYLGQGAPGFTATITATQILGNSAGNGTGGGLLADGISGKLTVSGSLVAGNLAKTGGGLASRGGGGGTSTAVLLTGNVLAGNEAENGAGLSLTGDGKLDLTKNLIVANDATIGGGAGGLQSIAAITLKANTVLGNRAASGVGGLAIDGPVSASFSTAGDVIAFNEGSSTGGLRLGTAIAGIIAKSTKITGNVGEGPIYGGGVTQDSTGAVKLLASVVGNFNRTNPLRNDLFGLFAA